MPPESIPTLAQWWGLCGHYDPESNAGGSVVTGSASHAGQDKGDDPDKTGYPVPPR
jgi:hypothetical protein